MTLGPAARSRALLASLSLASPLSLAPRSNVGPRPIMESIESWRRCRLSVATHGFPDLWISSVA